ncbi:Unknown protein [Striga hermonthica]|uniref:Uncharacterized protein n=1 Tax=Striga hermonthica TaxID=68872 RepID=A0A9N7MDA7_STRHE|nr:Unknown protein [Striga hermonthica]
MGPRISFSNDFADPQQPTIKLENIYREAPVSSEFAFSATDRDTIVPADQIFSEGKILPLRENCAKTTTIRDELLSDNDGFEDVPSRIAKGTSSWKERLGFKRSHVVVVPKKKSDKNFVEGSLESIDENDI